MSETKQSIRTLPDLRESLRRGDNPLVLSSLAVLDDWDSIFKHIGRSAGDPMTRETLRRLEIAVCDRLGLKIHSLAFKTLKEFARLCDEAFGRPVAKAKRSHGKPGRPPRYNPAHDAKLATAWKSNGYRTYEEGARELQDGVSGLTAKELRAAVDRDRHRSPKHISK